MALFFTVTCGVCVFSGLTALQHGLTWAPAFFGMAAYSALAAIQLAVKP